MPASTTTRPFLADSPLPAPSAPPSMASMSPPHALVNYHALGARLRRPQKSGLLVILDIHGVLVERVKRSDISRMAVATSHSPAWRTDSWHKQWLRPHLAAFLPLLFARHDVAVWSSAKWTTVDRFLNNVTSDTRMDVRKRLSFVWDRRRCTHDVERGGWATTKRLKELWKAREGKGRYSRENTLLLDDSPDKFRETPRSGVLVPPYAVGDGEHEDETLLWMLLYVEYRGEVGVMADETMTFEDFVLAGMVAARVERAQRAEEGEAEEGEGKVEGKGKARALAYVFIEEGRKREAEAEAEAEVKVEEEEESEVKVEEEEESEVKVKVDEEAEAGVEAVSAKLQGLCLAVGG